jgi:hypothetical protein
MIPSLALLCRTVVTNHLERYTPESFRICDIYEWDEIIQLRHRMTQPNKKVTLLVPNGNHHHHHHHHHNCSSSNDIDGNGRLLPAISEKVLQQIEECNEHLADSVVADTMVWKDCVEYRFKRNVGSLRPPILFEPWPLLVQRIQHQCCPPLTALISQPTSALITDDVDDNNNNEGPIAKPTTTEINEAIHMLQSTIWNVALLRDTGIGKIVKRLLKKISNGKKSGTDSSNSSGSCNVHLTEEHSILLQQLLSGWMQLANTKNTTGIYQWKQETTTASTNTNNCNNIDATIQASDLLLLEKCLSWRQLYVVLEHRKGIIQATQGKRMREIRNNVRYCVRFV